MPYERYLHTSWWTTRRNLALIEARYRCRRCGVKRDLQVHHQSYDRLGAELDTDLEVLCRGCHLGHHVAETQDGIALYARVISEVLSERSVSEFSDVVEEAKRRCAALRIVHDPVKFNAAVARLIPRFPFRPPAKAAELYQRAEPDAPIGRAEAAEILSRLGLAPVIKHMPQVQPLTRREMDRRRALGIVGQAILDQVQRCEDAERALADALRMSPNSPPATLPASRVPVPSRADFDAKRAAAGDTDA